MARSLDDINKQLVRVTWPFMIVVVSIATLAVLSVSALSGVRAFIGGESAWSKGQKDAVYYLNLYAETGREAAYTQYLSAMSFPMNLKRARLALERPEPDVELARAAFIASGNYPDDLRNAIWLFTHFRHVSYFDRAVQYWTAGDVLVEKLAVVGKALHAQIASGHADPDSVRHLTDDIWQINSTIAPLSREFSGVLAEAFREISRLLLWINSIAAGALIILAAWHTRRLLSQRARTESELRKSEERANVTLGSIGEAVISTRADGSIEYMNAAAERLSGRRATISVGRLLADVITLLEEVGRRPVDAVDAVMRGARADGVWDNLLLVRSDGTEVVVQAVASPIRSNTAKPAGMVLVLRNMMREREYIRSLAWQATHDGLTGIVNRSEFERRLSNLLDEQRSQPAPCALICLDLDQFKVVNDTCGHAAGDSLLRQVATQFQTCLRESDTLARLGGDEFGVLLRHCVITEAEGIADRLRTLVAELLFTWQSQRFTIHVSIGLVDLTGTRMVLEEALRVADIACYMAKEKGRDRVQVANLQDNELSRHYNEMTWGRRLTHALEENRFCLYTQAIQPVASASGRNRHAEILLRLIDENGNIVSPAVFIPAAERYGLMNAIDRWVVKTAFRQISWLSESGEVNIQYALNLSGASIGDERFLSFLREQFSESGIEPRLICFEVTETTAITNLASATRFIRELNTIGCKFALDDFGAGMSSFAYLKHLPVDYLKIDGSFVKDMLNDQVNRDMVAAINDIGQSMGRKTIAEYVENEQILDALRDLGVDYAQGYHIEMPKLWRVERPNLLEMMET